MALEAEARHFLGKPRRAGPAAEAGCLGTACGFATPKPRTKTRQNMLCQTGPVVFLFDSLDRGSGSFFTEKPFLCRCPLSIARFRQRHFSASHFEHALFGTLSKNCVRLPYCRAVWVSHTSRDRRKKTTRLVRSKTAQSSPKTQTGTTYNAKMFAK